MASVIGSQPSPTPPAGQLFAWLDGQDLDGSRNATQVDGSAITAAINKGSLGGSFAIGGAPVFRKGGALNGESAVEFSTGTQYLRIASFALQAQPLTICVVFKSTASGTQVIFAGGATNNNQLYTVTNNQLYSSNGSNADTTLRTTANQWSMVVEQSNGASSVVALDWDTAEPQNFGSLGIDAIVIGNNPATNAGFIGQVAEVLVYSGTISILSLRSYVTAKYGMMLGQISTTALGTDDGAAITALLNQPRMRVDLPANNYRIATPILLSLPNQLVVGAGRGLTKLIDVSTTQDAIQIVSATNCAVRDLTYRALLTKTAGYAFKLVGLNSITASPSQVLNQSEVTNVNIERAFIAMGFVDGPANQGCWETWADKIYIQDTAKDGGGILLNTPHGGQNHFGKISMWGDASASAANRAAYQVRIQGCNDSEWEDFTGTYTREGCVIDPPAGGICNVLKIWAGDFDSTTGIPIRIQPDAAVLLCQSLHFDNVWAANLAVQNVDISGPVTDVTFVGGDIHYAPIGVKLSGPGPKEVSFDAVDLGGCATAFWATSSAGQFQVNNCKFAPELSTPTGIPVQIDAGSDNYDVSGNDFRGASSAAINTPGTSATRIFERNRV